MILSIMANIIIPSYTVLLTIQDSLIESNLSVIATYPEYKLAFLIWALLIGSYFYIMLTKIIRIHNLSSPKGKRFLVGLSCGLLMLSAITPYIPEISQLKAFLHVLFAFSSTSSLLLTFLLITIELSKRFPVNMRYLYYTISIISISFLLFLLLGLVSGILEIFLTISCVLLTKQLYMLNQSSQLSSQKTS